MNWEKQGKVYAIIHFAFKDDDIQTFLILTHNPAAIDKCDFIKIKELCMKNNTINKVQRCLCPQTGKHTQETYQWTALKEEMSA